MGTFAKPARGAGIIAKAVLPVVRYLGRHGWAVVVAASLVCASAASAQMSQADQFFDWQDTTSAPTADYIPAPYLTDANAASVAAFLATEQSSGIPLAVKIVGNLAPGGAAQTMVFDVYKLNYVFGDLETSGYVNTSGPYSGVDAAYANMVNVIQGSTQSNTTADPTIAISGFPMAPINTDKTNPSPNGGPQVADFVASEVNTASEVLYPGDASFKTPSQLLGTSSAPNIRSNLFTLPIMRFSEVAVNLTSGEQHIPYISRFNDYDNPAFATGSVGLGIPTTVNGIPQFVTSDPTNATTYQQLLSRNDFSAMVLQYRMRGATNYQLLDPGVIGYTVAQMETDAAAGWNLNTANLQNLFADPTAQPVTYNSTITTGTTSSNGTVKTFEQAGMVWSGVVTGITNNTPPPPGIGAMAILISNLSATNQYVTFPGTVALGTITGLPNANNSILMMADTHELLQFTRQGSMWLYQGDEQVFDGGSSDGTGAAAMNSQEGVGVPEPASVGLLGLFGFALIARRRRKV